MRKAPIFYGSKVYSLTSPGEDLWSTGGYSDPFVLLRVLSFPPKINPGVEGVL